MAKTVEVITDALEDLVVQADEAPIEGSEARTAIRALNGVMAQLDAKGISLGYTNVSQLDDPVTIADGALEAVKALLALRLAPKYLSGEPPQSLKDAAREGMDALYHIAVNPDLMDYPDTLPRGSGNEGVGTYADRTFYDGVNENLIDSEINGSIALEDDTEADS